MAKLKDLTTEFLRLLANELDGRKFEYRDSMDQVDLPTHQLMVRVKADDLVDKLPELARQFATKIKPEFTRCHKIPPPAAIDQYCTVHDPISGISVCALRFYDVEEGGIVCNFGAAFS